MKNLVKKQWWIILTIGILVLPVVLNFLVFKPTCQLCVGTLQDWMSFWGSYLGAAIPAIVAFIILSIQRKDNKLENKKNRTFFIMHNNTQQRKAFWERGKYSEKDMVENEKEKQLNILIYEQERKWLCELRVALTDYICAYRENYINNIINSMYYSSYEYVLKKTEDLLDNLVKADTALELVILNNAEKDVGCLHKNRLNVYFNQYVSIIKDVQILEHLYYNKTPYISGSIEIKQHNPSNELIALIQAMGLEDHPLVYSQITEIANRLITPICTTVKEVRALGFELMQEEIELINKRMATYEKNE
jgi:hypothetical protein